jgi:hypothetical protein
VESFSEHDNESPISIKAGKFFEYLSVLFGFSRTLLCVVSLLLNDAISTGVTMQQTVIAYSFSRKNTPCMNSRLYTTVYQTVVHGRSPGCPQAVTKEKKALQKSYQTLNK